MEEKTLEGKASEDKNLGGEKPWRRKTLEGKALEDKNLGGFELFAAY